MPPSDLVARWAGGHTTSALMHTICRPPCPSPKYGPVATSISIAVPHLCSMLEKCFGPALRPLITLISQGQ